MRDVILVLFGVISTAALLCLCVFVAQMTVLKKVNWLYGRLFDGSGKYLPNLRRRFEKTYCYLGVIAFLFCIGAGSYHLLWWIPRNWGWLDEDGQWTDLRIFLGMVSALFVGGRS